MRAESGNNRRKVKRRCDSIIYLLAKYEAQSMFFFSFCPASTRHVYFILCAMNVFRSLSRRGSEDFPIFPETSRVLVHIIRYVTNIGRVNIELRDLCGTAGCYGNSVVVDGRIALRTTGDKIVRGHNTSGHSTRRYRSTYRHTAVVPYRYPYVVPRSTNHRRKNK